MIVNSYNQEFGYELLSAVPYAYELYLKGKLTETISAKRSDPLYYFSPKHTINTANRDWVNTRIARLNKLPYTDIHVHERPELKFPPYKEQFKNDVYKWKKPTLCICNRYNREWGVAPINYFSPEMLEWLFSNIKKSYEIVYFAVDLPEDIQDNAHSMPLNDIEVCRKHNIKVFQEIKGKCWNTSLLQVFANCDHYITMNGGYSILASFFEGTNIVYSRKNGANGCREFTYRSFARWYPNHNDQRTVFVESYEALKAKIKAIYIDKLPNANVIVRTSNRPLGFTNCLKSIEVQTYPNINIIVTTDDIFSCGYTRGHDARHLDMSKVTYIESKKEGEEFGRPFKCNLYLKEALKRIKEGFVIYLDDDDMFTSKDSVKTIIENAETDKLLIWKVDFNDKILPNGSFGKYIKLFDVTGIGFSHHVKYSHLTDWSEWKRADYRTAKKISDIIPVKWLDAVLTKLQSKPGNGKRIDLVTNKYNYMKTIRVIDPIIGQVGKLKRLADPIAAEMVKKGYAEYMSDVVDALNNTASVKGKPIVTENKELVTELENKSDGTQTNSNGNRPTDFTGGKTVSTNKPNKSNGRAANSGSNRGRSKKG